MIEKIPDQIPVQTGEWRGTTFDIIPKETFGMACRKINELIDAVNELQKHKEPAEAECVRLQNELERTRKALDVAVDALKTVRRYTAINQFAPKSREAHIVAKKALNEITALEQKDK